MHGKCLIQQGSSPHGLVVVGRKQKEGASYKQWQHDCDNRQYTDSHATPCFALEWAIPIAAKVMEMCLDQLHAFGPCWNLQGYLFCQVPKKHWFDPFSNVQTKQSTSRVHYIMMMFGHSFGTKDEAMHCIILYKCAHDNSLPLLI